ncbi:MAG: hypothetical protein ABL953_13475 [Ilumatobacteraceae bacterium]
MSDQRPFAPPVMPWLPAPTPRVVSAIPPPPNPWARIAANGHNPPPTPRKRRWWLPTGPALLAIIILGVGGAVLRNMDLTNKDAAPQQYASPVTIPVALDVPTNAPFLVQSEWLSFVMPMKPVIEEVNQNMAGTVITVTSWTIENDELFLRALTMDFQTQYDETSANRSFDGMVDASANINETVVSQTRLFTNGVYQRDALITYQGGYLHIRAYIKARGWWRSPASTMWPNHRRGS